MTLVVELCSLLYEGQNIYKLDSHKFWKNIRKIMKKKVESAVSLSIDYLYYHFKFVFSKSHENNNQNNDSNVMSTKQK